MRRAALALSLAVFAASLLPVPSAAQAGQPDLAVTSLVLTGPAPGWIDGAKNDTTVKVVVTNLGNAAIAFYEVDFYWDDADAGSTPMNGFGNGVSEGSLVYSERPLQPGESETFTAPWHLQPGQDGQGALRAVADIGGNANGESAGDAVEPNLANNVRSLPLFVPAHAFAFAILDAPMEAPAGGAGFFRLQVANLGNVADRFEFRLATAPSDSRLEAAIEPAALEVAPGSQANATLFVAFDPAGDDSPFSVRYGVEAKPAFGMVKSRDTPILNGTGEDPSLEGFSFTASREPGVLAAPSGATTPVRVAINNTGSRPDTYTVSARLEGGEGWLVSGTRVGLYAQERGEAVLPLVVPAGTPAGTRALLRLDVNASLLEGPVRFDVEVVAPGPVLSIDGITLDTGDAYVGDRPEVEVEVANDGLEVRPGAVLRLTTQIPGATPQRLEALLDGIAAGDRLVHRFPLETLEAGGLARFQADLVSPEGAVSPAVSMSIPVHAPELHVHTPAAMVGGPGESVAYRIAPTAFRVSNGGEMAERIELVAAADAGTAHIEGPSTLVLAPGETRTVAVVQGLPQPIGGRSLVGLSLTAAVAARPSLSWSAMVETALRDLDPPTLRPPGSPPAVWSLAHPFLLDVLAQDDDRVDAVNATVTDPDGNRTVVVLSPAADGHWTAVVPFGQAGDHSIRFAAKDPSGNAAQPLTLAVRAATVDPPVLRLEGLGDGPIHAGTVLRLAVEDPLGVVSATLEIRQGSSVLRRSLEVVGGNATVDLSGISPGPAELAFEAVDAAGASAILVAHVEVVESDLEGADPAVPPRKAPAFAGLSALGALALSGLARARFGRRGRAMTTTPFNGEQTGCSTRTAPVGGRGVVLEVV